jgi:transcriptional regulator with XRE-family HTH domain
MSLFSKNLRYLRKKGNYRQDQISAIFNKQANTVGNWEHQKSEPSMAELIRLSEFFNTNVQELLNSDLESKSPEQNEEPVPIGLQSNSNRMEESINSPENEVNKQAFWLILRELRLVHEKVDLLLSKAVSAGLQTASDKSSH